ncbi:NAD(P)/FAD-dependent oxidoreductase [Rhodococcus sp. NPDC057297]|uniref:NAD(P)/FAD-dependent oxidoreductase n=1 Tax=Rhodococcus sp. NPDC057297 TaxID=3346090 RepID=UPI00364392CE
MTEILIVGGGYAGLYTALNLEKKLHRDEAHVTLVDPRPYMTYQPFLPEVVSGAIEPRHTVVSLRRHLRRTTLVAATVDRIDHARKLVRAHGLDGRDIELNYDIVVVTAGAVTRTFPIPGLVDEAIGMKNVEEAVAIRDRLLTAFDRAAALPDGPERARLLTVTFVGGGFSGVEGFAEALSLATEQLPYYPEIGARELAFHLVEAQGRILPEVSDGPGRWVVRHLRDRGAHVHLNAQMVSAVGGHVVLSTGEEFDSDLIVWTAGNAANGVVARHTDLPVDARGFLVTRADLRVGTEEEIVADAWAAGDNAVVPDLAVGHGATTVPNAQHAVRQAKRLASNIVESVRGREPKEYVHSSLGVVATLGRGHGLFQYKWIIVKGWPAWAMHRGYHVLAVPTWERKVRVLLGWVGAFVGRRDIASLAATVAPRRAFTSSGVEPTPPTERVA